MKRRQNDESDDDSDFEILDEAQIREQPKLERAADEEEDEDEYIAAKRGAKRARIELEEKEESENADDSDNGKSGRDNGSDTFWPWEINKYMKEENERKKIKKM